MCQHVYRYQKFSGHRRKFSVKPKHRQARFAGNLC
jgi:hypothetical protein